MSQAQRRLPAEKFFFSYRRKWSNYYGDSDLRECYKAAWCKKNLIKFMTITLERYGEPTWVFNTTGELSNEHRRVLESFLHDLQSKSGLILPDTITAKPESPGTNAASQYIAVLEYLDGLIHAALGLPNLIGASTMEAAVGSYSRSQTQMDMWQTVLRYIRYDVEANLNEQIIKPLIDMNYDVIDGKYPTFKFKAISGEEKQAQYDSYLAGLKVNAHDT